MKQILLIFAAAMLMASCATTKRIADKGRELDILTHCDPADYPTTKDHFRASDIGHSADISIARRLALNKAKAKLAGDIKTDIKSDSEVGLEQERDTKNSDFAEIFGEVISSSVDQSLEEVETICSKLTKNSRSGEYTAYVTIQLSRNVIMENVRERLKNRVKR